MGHWFARVAVATAGVAVVIGAIVVTGGCGGEVRSAGPAVRDSAGVTIADYAQWDPDPLAWTIASEPVTEIGTAEGDEAYQLTGVTSLRRLSDGRIVVANTGTEEVRIYDETGRHLVTTGRKGEGPGEFDGLWWLTVGAGDTVIAYDGNLKRVSLFTADGVFVRSVTLDYAQGFPQLAGVFSDGTLLATRGFTFAPSAIDDVVHDSGPVLRFASDGALLDSIGRWLSQEWYVHGTRGETWATSLPFGRGTMVAVGPDGFYVGSSDRFEVQWRDREGHVRRIIRSAQEATPVTGADWARLKADRMQNVNPRWRPRQERMLAEIPVPSTRPAFGDLLTDPDGNLWVGPSVISRKDPQVWIVFAPDGRMRGSIQMPTDLRVQDIGRDYVLGVAKDDLDVEHVRLYPLRKAGDGG